MLGEEVTIYPYTPKSIESLGEIDIATSISQSADTTTIVNIEGFEGAIIEEGILVASDVVNFVVKESTIIDSTGTASVLVECEREGAIGNVPLGAIKYFPITISGLTKVSNPQTVTNGYMGENDEELRKRYYDKVRAPATSGNKYHYRNWALEIPGVGDVKVFPLWNGPGTVKIVVISSQKTFYVHYCSCFFRGLSIYSLL